MSKIKTDIIEPVGSTISISGNASLVSGTISANGYRPLVQIFRFVGDGYASSALQDI
jgi:hypothetical protein